MVNEERMEEIKKKLLQDKENRKKNVIEYFKTMKPFRTIDDIPDIPITDKDTYENIIIPNLIRCGAIPKDKLMCETSFSMLNKYTESVWVMMYNILRNCLLSNQHESDDVRSDYCDCKDSQKTE